MNRQIQTNYKARLAEKQQLNASGMATPTPPDQDTTPPKEEKVALSGHIAQIYADWVSTHKSSETAPIVIDPVTKEPQWVNRKTRRSLLKTTTVSKNTRILKLLTLINTKEKNRARAKLQKASRKANRKAA